MPIPKVKTTVKRVQRKRGKTAILTSSPYKKELTEAITRAKQVKEAQKNKVKKIVWAETEERNREGVYAKKAKDGRYRKL